jgi:hypothetical protein
MEQAVQGHGNSAAQRLRMLALLDFLIPCVRRLPSELVNPLASPVKKWSSFARRVHHGPPARFEVMHRSKQQFGDELICCCYSNDGEYVKKWSIVGHVLRSHVTNVTSLLPRPSGIHHGGHFDALAAQPRCSIHLETKPPPRTDGNCDEASERLPPSRFCAAVSPRRAEPPPPPPSPSKLPGNQAVEGERGRGRPRPKGEVHIRGRSRGGRHDSRRRRNQRRHHGASLSPRMSK